MIRIPDIPGLNGTRLNNPGVSAAAIAAPAVELGNVAETIAGVSDHFHDVAMQAQKQENARTVADKLTELAKGKAALDLELMNETDPAAIVKKTEDFNARTAGMMDGTDMPPAVRDILREKHSRMATENLISSGADAARLQSKRTLLAHQNEIELHRENNNLPGALESITRLQETGTILPEEAEKLKREVTEKIQLKTDQEDIVVDPDHWMQENPEDKPKPGYDPVQWKNLQNFAKGQLQTRTYEATANIQDGIASGEITKPGQIDFLAGDLRPAAREELKRTLGRRLNAEEMAATSTPEYQQQTVGQVAKMLSDYNPKTDTNWDENFVKMDSLVRTLPPGAVRDELERQIKAVRDEKTREPTTRAEAGDKALDAARDLFFPKAPDAEIMPTQRAMNDGFLRNPAKLQALGFSEDQAEAIIGSKTATDKQRADAFKIGWGQRANPAATPDPVASATARAILNGEAKVMLTNPEQEDALISARIQGEMRYGKAKTDYAEWKKLNPDATNQEVEEKIRSLAGESARQKLSSGIYDAKPSRPSGPKGADDSTSALPAGKDLTEIVKNFEASSGFHREAYWDYGQWSIGYGTKSKKGEVIDQAEADRRLSTELASHRARVVDATSKLGLKFNTAQLDALTSFDYNTGKIETLLAGGTRTPQQIADTMLLYRNADGQRLRGLEKRRKAERHLFLYGHAGGIRDTSTAKNEGDLSEYNVIQ